MSLARPLLDDDAEQGTKSIAAANNNNAPRASRADASTAEAVVAYVKICVGCGVLAMPWAFANGRALALPGMLAIGAWNYTMACMIVSSADAAPKCPAGGDAFSHVVTSALGPAGERLLKASLLPVFFGVCCSQQITSSDLLASMLPGVHHSHCAVASLLLLVPLTSSDSVRSLAYISALALLSLACGFALVFWYGFSELGVPRVPRALAEMPDTTGLSDFYGVAAFSFGFQSITLSIRDGMRKPAEAPLALGCATIVVVVAYCAIGLVGAWLFWSAGVEQLITLNLPELAPLAVIVKLCTALTALLSYPITFTPFVSLVLAQFGARKPPAWAAKALCLLVLALSTTVASVTTQFGVAAGVIGCLSGIYAQILPPLIHYRLVARSASRRAVDLAFVALGILAALYPASLLASQLLRGAEHR